MNNFSGSSGRKIAFIGGDARMLAAAEAFAAEENAECAVCGMGNAVKSAQTLTRTDIPEDAVRDACAVILPLPASKDGLRVFAPFAEKDIYVVSVLSLLKEEQLLIGGRTDIRFNEVHEKTFDYYEREEFKLMNAVPTAEGALEIAMRELDITLCGANALILGFGRVGRALAPRLRALGAEVCVLARSERDLAAAYCLNVKSARLDLLAEHAKRADCVFNTVPYRIFGGAAQDALRRGVPVIELASAPGCMDANEAEAKGIRYIPAQGLPGKCAPVTAGRMIKQTVRTILCEEGVL